MMTVAVATTAAEAAPQLVCYHPTSPASWPRLTIHAESVNELYNLIHQIQFEGFKSRRRSTDIPRALADRLTISQAVRDTADGRLTYRTKTPERVYADRWSPDFNQAFGDTTVRIVAKFQTWNPTPNGETDMPLELVFLETHGREGQYEISVIPPPSIREAPNWQCNWVK